MSEWSVASQAVHSRLMDVQESIIQLKHEDNHLLRALDLHKLIEHDIALVRSEIDNVEDKEKVFLASLCDYCTGEIYWSIGKAFQGFVASELKYISEHEEWLRAAITFFTAAADDNPKPVFWYQLALAYKIEKQYTHAISMLELAATGDDPKIAVEAGREIGRVKSLSSTSVSATSPHKTSVSPVKEKVVPTERSKKPKSPPTYYGLTLRYVLGTALFLTMVWVIFNYSNFSAVNNYSWIKELDGISGFVEYARRRAADAKQMLYITFIVMVVVPTLSVLLLRIRNNPRNQIK